MLKKGYKTKAKPVVDTAQGWLEILYYLGVEKTLKSEGHIRRRDYMGTEVKLPLSEFYGPYDVYEALLMDSMMDQELKTLLDPQDHKGKVQFGLPRPLEEYDIINIVMADLKTGKKKTMSILMIEEDKNTHLLTPGVQLQYRPGRKLAGLKLEQPVIL